MLGRMSEVSNRSYAVMPLDALGRTRATLTEPASTSPRPKGLGNLVKLCRAGDGALQLSLFNEECLVSASHQLALITSLAFDFYRMRGVRYQSFHKWENDFEKVSLLSKIAATEMPAMEAGPHGHLAKF